MDADERERDAADAARSLDAGADAGAPDGAPDDGASESIIVGSQRKPFSWRRFLLDGLLLAINGAVALAAVSFVAAALLSFVAGGTTTPMFTALVFSLAAPWVLIPLVLIVHPALEFLGRQGRRFTGTTVAVSIIAVVVLPAIGIWFRLYGVFNPTNRATRLELAGIGPENDAGAALATFGVYLVFVIPLLTVLLAAFLLLVAAGRMHPLVTVVAAVTVVAISLLSVALDSAEARSASDAREPAQVTDAAAAAQRIRMEMGAPDGLQQVRVSGRPEIDPHATVTLVLGPSTTSAQAHAVADAAVATAGRLGWVESTTVTIARAIPDAVPAAPTPPGGASDPTDPSAQQPPLPHADELPRAKAPWSLQLLPNRLDDTTQALDDLLELDALQPGVTATAGYGWASVDIADITRFLEVRTRLHTLDTFADGATYSVPGEPKRLRIVDVPDRMSDAAIAEIVAIAVAHPEAEVLLEAPTAGPQWPTLYVSGLNDTDAAAVVARLRSAEFVDANVHGFAVDFVIRSGGTGEYLTGTFGDVVE